MSQSSPSAKKRRKRDRFRRVLGIRPRSPPPTGADMLTSDSAIAPAPNVAQLLPRSGGSLELQLRGRIPGLTAPEPLGGPGEGARMSLPATQHYQSLVQGWIRPRPPRPGPCPMRASQEISGTRRWAAWPKRTTTHWRPTELRQN